MRYSPELFTQICERIAQGEFLKVICREEGMPHFVTVYSWINSMPEVAKLWRLAREIGAHWHADRVLEAGNEKPETYVDAEGNTRIDTGWVQWNRTRINSLQWAAAKLLPKEYGDKPTVIVQSPGGSAQEAVAAAQEAVDSIASAPNIGDAAAAYSRLMCDDGRDDPVPEAAAR